MRKATLPVEIGRLTPRSCHSCRRRAGCRTPRRSDSRRIGEIGLVSDEADRAAHRARAVKRALRPAQHFDVIQIVKADIGLKPPPSLAFEPLITASS